MKTNVPEFCFSLVQNAMRLAVLSFFSSLQRSIGIVERYDGVLSSALAAEKALSCFYSGSEKRRLKSCSGAVCRNACD